MEIIYMSLKITDGSVLFLRKGKMENSKSFKIIDG